MASKDGLEPRGLEFVPGEYRLLIDSRKGWAAAANALLDQSENDVIFVDDDVEITPTSLTNVWAYWPMADVFGCSLIDPRSNRSVSAGFAFTPDGQLLPRNTVRQLVEAALVPHVTASLMVIKKEVVKAGVRFPEWPGMHREDIAFTLDCWLRGFKVAYVPGVALHFVTERDMGATKSMDPEVGVKLGMNVRCLEEWMAEKDVPKAWRDGKIPMEEVPL